MDWSKAKTILIVALLITNLIVGGFYFSSFASEKNALEAAAQNTQALLAENGVALNCKIPVKPLRLPVAFINFESSGKAIDSYKGYALVITGEDNAVPVSSTAGESRGLVESASAAVIKTLKLNQDISSVDGIELVYQVDRSGYNQLGEDTAFPAWAVTTNLGTYYIEAL